MSSDNSKLNNNSKVTQSYELFTLLHQHHNKNNLNFKKKVIRIEHAKNLLKLFPNENNEEIMKRYEDNFRDLKNIKIFSENKSTQYLTDKEIFKILVSIEPNKFEDKVKIKKNNLVEQIITPYLETMEKRCNKDSEHNNTDEEMRIICNQYNSVKNISTVVDFIKRYRGRSRSPTLGGLKKKKKEKIP